ncbi:MAG: glycosyltransferase family 2 protein [Kiritimatiellae bacterium]|nr:glycosyltransferase family 2 protein [Kiritimatiellia bacterium]MDW8458474.1 glycosyltransferase family 2 protein [Verrucomicrobiota bacterium]
MFPPSALSGQIISLVIPAYNEEDAILNTLRRALAVAENPASFPKDIARVEIIVVSDGSRDRTAELARSLPGVTVVEYGKNRGYGKAIETGFAVASGDILAFMDADGTCDPAFLFDLWNEMQKTGADIVLGSRLHSNSRMPLIRRVGNTLYAILLSAISGRIVRDTASGMRILKRSLLPLILPLPSGLSFTPAMSARCLLDPRIHIGEIPMPYHERQGTSKLRVLRDGFMFLHVILVTALFYTPLRMFWTCALALLLAAALSPAAMRLPLVLSAELMAATGLLFHFFSKKILPDWPTSRLQKGLSRFFRIETLVVGGFVLLSAGCFLLNPDSLIREATLYASGLSFMLAAGRFILRQMDAWHATKLDKDTLLKDVVITRT